MCQLDLGKALSHCFLHDVGATVVLGYFASICDFNIAWKVQLNFVLK